MPAGLTRPLESTEVASGGHAARVSALAVSVARRLGWDDDRLAVLRLGGWIHDIGKLALSEGLLRKPGPLTQSERSEIETHPAAGARMLAPVGVSPRALACVLYHHERWDGAGYPSGRAATEIPVEARLLAIADAFDAMTSQRPYRAAMPTDEALSELERCAGTQFDPQLVRVFAAAWRAHPQPALA
ncbi:MAG: HD-GYP domain-containing protein [Actinobacteria bacterium]|nr:HD-GYP domain-containing protein [Actinomycetota bacterium]